MGIHWDDQEVINACIGGTILGIATSLHLGLKGQITGMSGTIHQLLLAHNSSPQKLYLLLSMFIVSAIFYLTTEPGKYFETTVEFTAGLSTFGFIFAGYFVGLGTKLGNGCTSGHGLCGLPRFSIRSFVAVMVFLTSAIATATIKYYGFKNEGPSTLDQPFDSQKDSYNTAETSAVIGVSIIIMAFVALMKKDKISDCMVSGITGALFATGLIISGMVKRSVVLGFLTIADGWNPALMFVLACGVGLNLITFYFIQKRGTPLMGEKLCIPTNTAIDLKLIAGTCLFGIGWGVGGMCPGPVMCVFPIFFSQVIVLFVPGFILGSYSIVLGEYIQEKRADKSQENYHQM